MLRYTLRRLLSSVLLLWGVATLTFAMIHLAPGEPLDLMLDVTSTPADAQALRAHYGLDLPLHVQYGHWLARLLRGDLGVSLRYHRPVAELLADAVPMTLRLAGLALLLDLGLGTALGVLCAAQRGGWIDRATTIASLAIYSMPSFWLALMLQLLFAYKLRWLPSTGSGDVPLTVATIWPWFTSSFRHVLLPMLVLGLAGAAGTARFMRSSMLEVLQQEYMRTARAKGLHPWRVLLKHGLRNAAIPLVTLAGLSLPFLLSGAVVTEWIFAWPGMGRVTVEAMLGRDVPVILATTLLSGALVVLGSLLADLAYAWLDPRIRVQ
jgi:peptide/nickel transport system permease protein